MDKLQLLAEIEGFDTIESLLRESMIDSVCPAICVNIGCDYTTQMEPDQDKGWCESCQTNTVKSSLILAGMI